MMTEEGDMPPYRGMPPIQGAFGSLHDVFGGAIGAHEGASEADGRGRTQCAPPWVRPCL